MQINENHLSKAFYALVIGISGYCCYTAHNDIKNYRSIDDIKKEIKEKDPKRYDSLLNSDFYGRSYREWEYEERLMNESLKVDSLVQRAYFEGAQMTKDSIKNTEKKKEK